MTGVLEKDIILPTVVLKRPRQAVKELHFLRSIMPELPKCKDCCIFSEVNPGERLLEPLDTWSLYPRVVLYHTVAEWSMVGVHALCLCQTQTNTSYHSLCQNQAGLHHLTSWEA